MSSRVTVVACVALALACQAPAAEEQAAAAPDPEVLMEADRAFAAEVAAAGSESWASWFAEDGAMVQQGRGEVRGRAEIRAAMAGLDQPGVTLAWEPERADISSSGDLGWTTGAYVSEGPGPDGQPVRSEGRYVSIWRLQADGSWKVVMDLGNPTSPPPG